MSLGIYFIVALILSFLGTVPIGLITLTITQKTIQNGRQSGIMIAIGATVMEFIYTYVALISLDFFSKSTIISDYIKIFSTVVFFSLGIYFLWKKSNATLKATSEYDYFDFLRGITVGMMNMLIVPFWIFLGIWLESNGMFFKNKGDILIFSIGAAIGALIAFFGYILLSEYIVSKTKEIDRYTNKVVGLIFLGLGIFQMTQLF